MHQHHALSIHLYDHLFDGQKMANRRCEFTFQPDWLEQYDGNPAAVLIHPAQDNA